jgi:hypothetical protein
MPKSFTLESCAALNLYQRRLCTLEERQIEHPEGQGATYCERNVKT